MMHINNKLVVEKLLKDRYYKLSNKNVKQLTRYLIFLLIALVIGGILFIQNIQHVNVATSSLTMPFIMVWIIVGCVSAAQFHKENSYFMWVLCMYVFMFFVARGQIFSAHIAYPIVNDLCIYVGVTLIVLIIAKLILSIRAVIILMDVQKYYLQDVRMMELLAMFNKSHDLSTKLLLLRHIDNNRGFMPICINDLVRFVALKRQWIDHC